MLAVGAALMADGTRNVGGGTVLLAAGGTGAALIATGVGEIVLGADISINATLNMAKGYNYGKEEGSYTNTHESEKTYSGKGPEKRAKESADRVTKEYKDPLKKTDWKPSKNTREAFKAEHKRIKKNGGANNPKKNYNKINSPGKKYSEIDKTIFRNE